MENNTIFFLIVKGYLNFFKWNMEDLLKKKKTWVIHDEYKIWIEFFKNFLNSFNVKTKTNNKN